MTSRLRVGAAALLLIGIWLFLVRRLVTGVLETALARFPVDGRRLLCLVALRNADP